MIGKTKQPFIIEIELDDNFATHHNAVNIYKEIDNKNYKYSAILMHHNFYHDLLACPITFGYVNHFEGDFHPTIFNLKIIRTNDINPYSVFLF